MVLTTSQAADEAGVDFDIRLLRKLGRSGSCYATYPTVEHFDPSFDYRDYLHAVAALRTRGSIKPLSLHLTMPPGGFACTNRGRDKGSTYLAYLKREIEMRGMLFAGMNQLAQLHCGGAVAAVLSELQLGDLMAHLRRWFLFAPDGDYAIDLEPNTVSADRVASLRQMGFNRVSIGAQACRQAESALDTEALIAAVRAARFDSLGMELACGLPHQTVTGLAHTLGKVIDSAPDRIMIVDYPGLRRLADGDYACEARLDMRALCVRRLDLAGYVHLGMDHFARRDGALALARRQGRLYRNVDGYSSHAEYELLGCGLSAVSSLAAAYSQNVRTPAAYYELIDRNELPIGRGHKLSMDDALRRTIIQMFMCAAEVSIPDIEQAFPIPFSDYFAVELGQLDRLAADGVLTIGPEWLSVTPKGHFFIPHICAVFDRYLNAPEKR